MNANISLITVILLVIGCGFASVHSRSMPFGMSRFPPNGHNKDQFHDDSMDRYRFRANPVLERESKDSLEMSPKDSFGIGPWDRDRGINTDNLLSGSETLQKYKKRRRSRLDTNRHTNRWAWRRVIKRSRDAKSNLWIRHRIPKIRSNFTSNSNSKSQSYSYSYSNSTHHSHSPSNSNFTAASKWSSNSNFNSNSMSFNKLCSKEYLISVKHGLPLAQKAYVDGQMVPNVNETKFNVKHASGILTVKFQVEELKRVFRKLGRFSSEITELRCTDAAPADGDQWTKMSYNDSEWSFKLTMKNRKIRKMKKSFSKVFGKIRKNETIYCRAYLSRCDQPAKPAPNNNVK